MVWLMLGKGLKVHSFIGRHDVAPTAAEPLGDL